MKKICLLLALLCSLSFYGQRRVAAKVNQLVATNTVFTPYSPFTVSDDVNTGKSSKAVTSATYAVLNSSVARQVTRTKPQAIELSIPYNGSLVTLQLYRVEITAENFHVDTNKEQSLPYHAGAYYRGIVKGDDASIASFNFFDKEVNGIISCSRFNNLVVGRLTTKDNLSDYIIYSDSKLTKANDFTCGVADTQKPAPEHSTEKTFGIQSQHCVTLYFEVDYDLFLLNNSSVAQTNNWVFSMFNNVQTLYDNDGITVAIKSIFVWTEPDPYFGDSSSDYLFQFYQARPYFDGDLGQLLGVDEGGLGGVAIDIAGICSDENVSYSDVNFEFMDVPVFSWTVEVVTHELGHLMGSPHTHGCYWNGNNTAIDGCGTSAGYVEGNCDQGPIPFGAQGTIMSYCHLVEGVGINFANGFGPQPAARILQHVASSGCLSSDCINTCINSVVAFDVSQNTQTAITVNWTDAGDVAQWQVGITNASGVINQWITVNQPTYTFTGLTPNTYYKFAVRPVCTMGQAAQSQVVIVATAADWCAGITFTDTGGANNYPNDQHLLRTIKPQNPATETITVTFSSFATEAEYDFMYVYDGPNTDSPLIGAYDGTEIPGPFTATSPDKALTFEFVSDQFTTDAGWVATTSCAVAAAATNAFAQLTYYPNPTNGMVTIASPEGITGITVYNVAGQLLLQKEINNRTEAEANISSFADGVYFFKVTNGTKQANFRIIKQQ
jgi:hypothetical protein